ncbi:MAG: hypothetical protein WCK09_21025 [Bacteroidota bacterium]
MTPDQLQKANELSSDILACRSVLESFYHKEWEPTKEEWSEKTSTNPVLFIEYEDGEGGREMLRIPGVLQQDMIAKIKTYTMEIMEQAQSEFNEL